MISSAQRLSASKIVADLDEVLVGDAIVKCSTPFGIKDRGSLEDDLFHLGGHRCSTPFGIKDRGSAAKLLT